MNMIAIVGPSGAGKSTALGNVPELGIKGLSPVNTALVNVNGKPLPYRGWMQGYKPIKMTKNPAGKVEIVEEGNYLASDSAGKIVFCMNHWMESSDIKNIVVDDGQYVMANYFMSKALQSGYDKYNVLAKNMFDVLNAAKNGPADKNFILLTHDESTSDGSYKMKTIGQLLDSKITLEGLFTVVLYAAQEFDKGEAKKFFVTNYDGKYPAKSPVGMFKDIHILNDLDYVVRTVNNYYLGVEDSE